MGQALKPTFHADSRCSKVVAGIAMGSSLDLQRSQADVQWCGTDERKLCKAHFAACCGSEAQSPEETADEPWSDNLGATKAAASPSDKEVQPQPETQQEASAVNGEGKSEMVVQIIVPDATREEAARKKEVGGLKASVSSWDEKGKEGVVSLLDAVPLDTSSSTYREVDCPRGRYCGQVSSDTGEFHGLGRLTMKESTAVGLWQDGFLHGPGQEAWTDGRRYTGEFLAGAFSGHGRMHWYHPRGGMVYDGQYLEDRKHGWGRFSWPSGRVYEGQWVCGRREGIGIEISAGGSKCGGLWEDNVFLSAVQEEEGAHTKSCVDEGGAASASAAAKRADDAFRNAGISWPEDEPLWPIPVLPGMSPRL